MFLGRFQPAPNPFDVLDRRLPPTRSLLLKGTQHVDDAAVSGGIDDAVRIAALVYDDLENVRAAKLLQRLGIDLLVTPLSLV